MSQTVPRMSEPLPSDRSHQADYDSYRVLSMRAVAALSLGILSLPALLLHVWTAISLVGVLVGWNAVSSVKKSRNELTGLRLARAGLYLSLITLVGGLSTWAFVYATEVPDGYQRISFSQLQPDPKHPQIPVSPMSLDLDGQKIFVKGFIYPSDKRSDLKQFVLVPDRGTCCFGGQPKLTDMIEVTLKDPLRVKYSYSMRRLAGVLRVDKTPKPVSGLNGVYYQLEADYVK